MIKKSIEKTPRVNPEIRVSAPECQLSSCGSSASAGDTLVYLHCHLNKWIIKMDREFWKDYIVVKIMY